MFKILTDYPDTTIEKAWRECLNRAFMAGHYDAPEYFREPLLGSRGRFAVLALEDKDGGEPVVTGVLTGVRESGQVTSGLGPRPQMSLDKSRNEAETTDSLVAGLLSAAGAADLITVYTWGKSERLVARGFTEHTEPGVVLLDLSKGVDALFAGCLDRSSIRAATRFGVDVREATDEDIIEYYRIRSAWSEQKGLPCDSLEVCQQLFRLRNNRRLLVAFHEGKVVAGSVLRFLQGSLVEYAANSSWPEARRLRPNDLLQWKAIEWACRQGFRYYSMGGSSHFHKKFGGTVVPTYRYRLDRTLLRRHDRKDELIEYARKLYHRLPNSVRSKIRRWS
jgi:hypothetical protein